MNIPKIIKTVGPAVDEKYIEYTENHLKVKFPESYINCLRQGDQGTFENPLFTFKDPISKEDSKSVVGALISFDPACEHNILKKKTFCRYFNSGVIPIAEVGNGDYICLDYSIPVDNYPDPPVFLLLHKNPWKYRLGLIAMNFDEFLARLEPDDE